MLEGIRHEQSIAIVLVLVYRMALQAPHEGGVLRGGEARHVRARQDRAPSKKEYLLNEGRIISKYALRGALLYSARGSEQRTGISSDNCTSIGPWLRCYTNKGVREG